MGQNAGRRAPTFSVFFDGRQARAVASPLLCTSKLEQRRILAKNAATRHHNAMGIAPKVVEGSLLQPLTLMFRSNAAHIASQIPWVMRCAELLRSNPELPSGRPTPGSSGFRERSACVIGRCDQPDSFISVLPPPPLHHRMFPLVPPANLISRRPP